MAKGLLVSILRCADGYDCTRNGVSSRVKSAIVTGPGIPEISEPNEDYPELVLCEPNLKGAGYPPHVKPKEAMDEGKWLMFGGNFVYTSDSRFPTKYPLAIHDRWEG